MGFRREEHQLQGGGATHDNGIDGEGQWRGSARCKDATDGGAAGGGVALGRGHWWEGC